MMRTDPRTRYSVPSWVIPGGYLENLRFLADKPVAGVELLFFIYDDGIARLFEEEFDGILGFRERFTFTAHLPGDLRPEHEALVERLAPLARHFIAHPAAEGERDAQARLLDAWAAKYAAAPHPRFLLENTAAGLLEDMLPRLDESIGVCMDTGHLLEQGQNPAEFMARHGDRIREIHLHGLDREKAAVDGHLPDHSPLRADAPWLQELLPSLRAFPGVVNIEVFSWEEAAQSLQALSRLTPPGDPASRN
ncbi:MAG: TIM barrel protein [Candidatus Accumulibacter sp.]|jgi:hypothetical protein|nr:TIM barrel protein [Accumulibacter sp.]